MRYGRRSINQKGDSSSRALEAMEMLYPSSERWDRVNLGKIAQGIKQGVALRPDAPGQELTYGEFEIESLEECLSAATHGLKENNVDLLDIGSGTGRLVMCAALLFPEWSCCRGVEISPALYADADARRIRAENQGLLGPGHVHFACANVLTDMKLEFPHTNLFFIYATAFPAPRFNEQLRAPILNDEWTRAIRRIVSTSKCKHIRIATTDRALDPHAGFDLVNVLPNVKNRETFGSALYIHDVLPEPSFLSSPPPHHN
eukprot:CAMPEP_0197326972 /NCGR_PEP_ID=MMETSP0892-20130614/2266_1 /TAXON_ID=44058 ORGANISM="Aureoumbra lagunensis, Strain CCMP1510" /NCGR_SAMPLE_ID=MMETSP0892 /ASSEMBLY_ACC=CAM_ASM_000538 /LENGTH=258 /DNA_ID=CAMNT_0042821425 /DNA_START=180 /DNA_END=956 /DNA_ORIENTATION=+